MADVILHPDLAALREAFTAIRSDAERLVAGLDTGQFNLAPAAGRWSIAQCLVHLNLVDGPDLEPMARAIAEGRRKGMTGAGVFRYGPITSWFVRLLEPESKFKAKSPRAFVPSSNEDPETALGEFVRIQNRLGELLVEANGLDLVRVKTPTPVASWVKVSLGQRFRMIAAHDRRHLQQAWRVRETLLRA